ncbi:MAG: dihydroorotate dehydrogenase electron transfer subunit, partial [Thermoplasmata archaeon]|nr:dihydroorotate dehydrogenase electron transfer subunit [Thermoplasmata archaeon]
MDIVKILDNRKEAGNIFTLDIDWQPRDQVCGGQFVMIWIPDVDEIPMSISSATYPISMTIQKVGKATEVLHNLKPGDKIGIRGPFGKGFSITGQNILFIAGGVGIAPIMPALERALAEGRKVMVAIGGRTGGEIAFMEKMKALGVPLHMATDDGSAGFHGFVTDLAKELISNNNFDQIITCGPEIMMVKVLEIAGASNIPVQCSLERYMKCGIGICG